MSWSLFRITQVDTSGIERELKRLADMQEIRLRLEHDYHVTPPQPLNEPSDAEPSSVEYASDTTTATAELKDEIKKFQAIVDEEDEVDPI